MIDGRIKESEYCSELAGYIEEANALDEILDIITMGD